MNLKLSNFLNHIRVFLDDCYLESESTDISILNIELQHIDYDFNRNKIQLLNYVLDNFTEFEMIFSYQENEFNAIYNQLKINKSIIFDKLINDYNLEDDGLGNYTEWEIQRMNNDKYCVGCEKTTNELYHDNYSTGLCCKCNDIYDNKSGFCSLSCCLSNSCDGSC